MACREDVWGPGCPECLAEDDANERARREGVIEGLKKALHLRQYGVIKADHIRAEIERLKAEQKKEP